MSFDPDFGTATEAAEAIRAKRISSEELTRHVFQRVDEYDSKLNCFVYLLREEAMEAARAADRLLAEGKATGPLHGVPVSVKESFAVKGRPCTWGIPDFRDTKAPADSDVVQKLREAGAVLTGATNVPVNLQDWQSANPIYGVTNNPYDLSRTPGGSSGGAAAALAAGLCFFSPGSDIGGSIRVPSHFCGVFGHKPTIDLISEGGHLPGGNRVPPGFSTGLAAAGPMARSADDLILGMKLLAGPLGHAAKAFRWSLPSPRHTALREFRIGYVFDDPEAPVSAEVKAVLEKTLGALEKSGAKLIPGWPQSFQLTPLVRSYKTSLAAVLYAVAPKEAQAQMDAAPGEPDDWFRRGSRLTHAEWMRLNFARLGYRAQWQDYFGTVDVFLSPVAFVPAFPHIGPDNASGNRRTLQTPEGDRDYNDLFCWIATATLTGCPATVAPVGVTASGLPVGIQVMGPMWEDATPIVAAGLIAQEAGGGFQAPAGWR